MVVTRAVEWPGAVSVDELDAEFDVAVAFGWRACMHLPRVNAHAYAYFVQALEDALLWQGDERRLVAGMTYDLPLQLVTDSDALADALRERNPQARVALVPRIHDGPARGARGQAGDIGPLRVLVASGDPAILERAGARIEAVTFAANRGPDAYAGADVVLELTHPEQPLEAAPAGMLWGCVPVVHPVRGHTELVDHEVSGIVVDFDDVSGAASALQALAADRERLRTLSANARARAAEWPAPEDAARSFADLLTRLERDDAPLPRRLLLNARAAAEPVARERRALEDALRRRRQDVDELLAEVDALRADRDDARRQLEEQYDAARVGHALGPVWRPLVRLRRRLRA